MEKLASNQYLLVHSRSKEDRYDINDASAGEIYPILVSESTMCTVQSPRRREHRASLLGLNPTTTSALDMLISLPYVASKDADYP